MSRSLIDTIHNARDSLAGIGHRLDVLAHSLRVVGMDKLAEELEDMASNHYTIGDDLSSALSDDLNTRLNETQQNTGNLLTAVIAGISISKREAV